MTLQQHALEQGTRRHREAASRRVGSPWEHERARLARRRLDLVNGCVREVLSRPHYCRGYADWAHVMLYGRADAREHMILLIDTITAHLHESQSPYETALGGLYAADLEDPDAFLASAVLRHLDHLMDGPFAGAPKRRADPDHAIRCVHTRTGCTLPTRRDTLEAFLAAVQSDCPEGHAFHELPELIRLCAEGAHRRRRAPARE